MLTKTWSEAELDGDVVDRPDEAHPVRNWDGEDALFCTWEYALARLGVLGLDPVEARAQLEAGVTIKGDMTSWSLARE